MIGKKLAHYEITEKIGAGGMGEVYRARDSKLQRDVAIKVLPADMASDDEKRSRFEREALAVAALKHPNVVTIHGVDEVDGLHFIVMELVEGATLANAIPPTGLALDKFFEVSLALADALSAAHDRGITHRDLKPANVMLDEAGRVKVLDFGLAKLWEPASADAGMTMPTDGDTHAGQILGTASYMSPEQAQGQPVDARSDVFSLGVILFEMSTGKKPFEGDTNISVISSVIKDEPSSATAINPKLPRHLARIIARCLVKDPERRYQSAKELRNELEGLKRELDTGELDASDVREGTGPRRGPLAVLAAAAAIALVAVFVLRDPSPPEPPTPPPTGPKQATVGVIGFQNLADPSDSENLGRMLVALVTTHLAESGRVSVASMPRVLEALEHEQPDGAFDPKFAADAAHGAGVSLMVVGQVGKLGQGLVLTAELIDVESGETLGSHQERGESTEDLFTMAGVAAASLSEFVPGRGGGEGSGVDLAQVLTDSPEAYRHYVGGELALHEGAWESALSRLNDAIEVDSTFALAYYRAAIASWWNNGDETLAILERGLPHVGRAPERWQTIYRATLDYFTDEYSSAEASLSRLVGSGIDIPDAYYLLGEIQTHATEYVDSGAARKNFETALELDPSFLLVSYHLMDCYVRAHDLEGGERLLRRFESAKEEFRLDTEAKLRLAQGRFEEAVAAAEQLANVSDGFFSDRAAQVFAGAGRPDLILALPDPESVSVDEQLGPTLDARASFHATRGNLREAADHWTQSVKWFSERRGYQDDSAVAWTWVATCLALIGEFGMAEEASKEAARAVPLSRITRYVLGWTRLRAGDVEGAEEALAELDRVVPEIRAPHADYWSVLLRAELHLAAEQPGRAQAELEPLSLLLPEYRPFLWEQFLRGRVAEALGDPDAAAIAYQEALRPIRRGYGDSTVLVPLCLYHLARTEESAGRTAEARTHYEEFLRLWGEADAELTQVNDARERLARLSG